jgi:hypothetical protein
MSKSGAFAKFKIFKQMVENAKKKRKSKCLGVIMEGNFYQMNSRHFVRIMELGNNSP